MIPWLQSWKKAAPVYARLLREMQQVERLAKLYGWKIRPRKQ